MDQLLTGPSLFVLGTLELDAALQVGSHEARVKGRITSLDLLAALLLMQPKMHSGLLGCITEHTLLPRVQLFIQESSQVLLCRAVLKGFYQSAVLSGVALTSAASSMS